MLRSWPIWVAMTTNPNCTASPCWTRAWGACLHPLKAVLRGVVHCPPDLRTLPCISPKMQLGERSVAPPLRGRTGHTASLALRSVAAFALQACGRDRPDGGAKIRAVDHFSWSSDGGRSRKRRKTHSVNGQCELPEKLSHDHLDALAAAMTVFVECAGGPLKGGAGRRPHARRVARQVGETPALWKADVDAAFRQARGQNVCGIAQHVEWNNAGGYR